MLIAHEKLGKSKLKLNALKTWASVKRGRKQKNVK